MSHQQCWENGKCSMNQTTKTAILPLPADTDPSAHTVDSTLQNVQKCSCLSFPSSRLCLQWVKLDQGRRWFCCVCNTEVRLSTLQNSKFLQLNKPILAVSELPHVPECNRCFRGRSAWTHLCAATLWQQFQSKLQSYPVTEYWHRASHFKRHPHNTRRQTG